MGSPPARPDDPRWLLADAIARVVTLREALEDGSFEYAATIAERLELDLAALMERLNEVAAA